MDLVSELLKRVDMKQIEIKDSLAQGSAINIETYNRLVGNYQGLGEVKHIINYILEENEKEDL